MHPEPEQVFALIRNREGAVWLDGGHHPTGWSILAWDPTSVMTNPSRWPEEVRLPPPSEPSDPSGAPFQGGVIGYVGYSAGSATAPVPDSAPTPEPPVWLGHYSGGLCFRHSDRTWHPTGDPGAKRQARELLVCARDLDPAAPAPPGATANTVDREDYLARVRHILDLLMAGDCYQINLTRPLFVKPAGDAWEAYRRLRSMSAPAYGAWLRVDEHTQILCNSPELLMRIDGERVVTEPIKGTRPRAIDPLEDARLAEELAASRKDAAELTMIVDLCRNDLGRVALPGSVRTQPPVLTSHANVHHRSQQVSCKIDPTRVSPGEVLAALFPPGSVTGAPKIRATQRIAELEPFPRGVYCGAIGYISACGKSAFNVAIRTAVFHRGSARYHVGGGVVVDSDPSDEWLETEHKGSVLHRALTGEHPR